jgi:hypothetical protein
MCARTLRGVTDTADAIHPPRTIVAAFVATIASAVLSVVSAALWWGYQGYLRNEFYKANNKLKAGDKNKKSDYDINTASGLKNINHDVHNWLMSGLVQSLVFGLAIVLVALSVRRGKNWARWLLLVLFAIPLLPTAAPYRLLTIAGSAPALTRVASALVGITGLAVVVLLLVPESSRYFAAVRAEQLGEGAESAAPTGLRGLFSPRMPPGAGASRTASKTPSKSAKPSEPKLPDKPVAARPAKQAAAPPPAKQAKAKLRAGAEADASSTPARPASSVAAKSRSKSRKGS